MTVPSCVPVPAPAAPSGGRPRATSGARGAPPEGPVRRGLPVAIVVASLAASLALVVTAGDAATAPGAPSELSASLEPDAADRPATPTAPAEPPPPPSPRTLADLAPFEVMDLHLDPGAAVLLLGDPYPGAGPSVDMPSGAPNFLRRARVALVDGRGIRSVVLDRIALCGTAERRMVALDVGVDRIRAFVAYRGLALGNGYDGAVYEVDRGSLALLGKRQVFENCNWGWFPRFERDAVVHFSFAGRYEMRDAARGPGLAFETAQVRSLDALRARSGGLLPGPSEPILAALAARGAR